MDERRETEKLGYAEGNVGTHDEVDHQVAECLTEDNTEDSVVVAAHRNEVAESVVLAGSSCCQSDAE